MADRWAVATGSWSSTATWNGGTLPTSADDVYADGFTVTIDQDVTVLSIRTTQRSGGTINGGFTITGTRIVNANLIAGTVGVVLTCNASSVTTITGQITANNSASNQTGVIRFRSNSTSTVTSSTFSGSTSGSGAIQIFEAGCNITLIGNVSSGGLTIRNDNIAQTVATFISIVGNVSAGGIYAKDWNTENILTFTITGTLSGAAAIRNTSNVGWNIILNGTMQTDANGFLPFTQTTSGNSVRLLIHSTNAQEHQYRVNNAGIPGVARSLYTGGQNLGQPTANHVRSGQTYGVSNEFTGTLAVPNPSYVSAGVPTDNTVGTLAHLTSTDLQAALSPNAPVAVQRTVDDTKAITFSWPASGATITGQKSIDNGAYSAVSGAIAFLRTESNRHYYTLAYNANDRLTVEGTIRYKMTDGTYTKYFNLHLYDVTSDVTVYPTQLQQEDRAVEAPIKIYTGESGTQYFFAIDADQNPINLTGKNLELRFADTASKKTLYTAKTSNGSLSVTLVNKVTFTKSLIFTRYELSTLRFSLRDMSAGEEVLLAGPVKLVYAP
jgi:hypothetical protein